MLYYFYGVSFGKDRMIGYINSKELIQGFKEEWIPAYQRERILRRKKINALVDIYRKGLPIDSVKLNLIGKTQRGTDDFVLDGEFHVIDGQQRIWALKDSGVLDYKLPVELYVNIDLNEEIRLFHQFNSEPSKLTFGELAKSYTGPIADLIRQQMTTGRKNMALPLSVNSTANGLTLSTYCPVVLWISRKLSSGAFLESVPTGRRLKNFLQEDHDPRQILLIDFAVRNFLKQTAEIFGDYDHKATAYRRGFFLAWSHVVINNFLDTKGTFDFGKFENKIEGLHGLLRNSRMKEMLSASTMNHGLIYNMIIEVLNHKLKSGHLPEHKEITSFNADEDDLDLPQLPTDTERQVVL
jgi:hypothetical protein